ncbi:hypothetical protein HOY80DRAFT_996710 [Tuber brumale]|nr:hypothetical protein HOY80DRAFT_996710 [Tuber brumale]
MPTHAKCKVYLNKAGHEEECDPWCRSLVNWLKPGERTRTIVEDLEEGEEDDHGKDVDYIDCYESANFDCDLSQYSDAGVYSDNMETKWAAGGGKGSHEEDKEGEEIVEKKSCPWLFVKSKDADIVIAGIRQRSGPDK